MRTVAGPGRWVWGLAGLATVLALTFGGVVLVTRPWSAPQPPPQVTTTRTVTLVRPVTSLTVQSYGGAIRITSGPVGRIQVSDTLTYGPMAGGQPAVTESLSRGHLILADPACSQAGDCFVNFAVTVPPGVAVTAMTDGGSLSVSGTGAANLDSGGGPVTATRIGGPLTVSTEGGSLWVDGLSGALNADTFGGSLTADRRRRRGRHGQHGRRRRADHLLGRAAAGNGQHQRRPGRADRARRPVRADRRQQRRPAVGGDRDQPRRASLDHHQQRRRAGAGYARGAPIAPSRPVGR